MVDVGMFKGINLSPLVNLAHMFYVNDAVFVGQWCDGTKVRGNMFRVQAWTEVVDKVKSRLENPLHRSIRGGVEQVQFNELSDMLQSVSLVPYSDRWVWSLEGSREFSIAYIRKIIDDNRLSTVDTRTLWIKCVPIKVNILAWKIKMEALPTRCNISRR
nr:RNA-directed DNA polymerase, eukaryota [Tanacetum cinerariifolium]